MNQQKTARQKKLCHDKDRIDTIIRDYHDRSLQGHPDIFETLQLLRQECNFPSTRPEVEAYFKRCLSYQHDKGEEEQSSWNRVKMDFIIKLSRSKDPTTGIQYDSILVLTDSVTGYPHVLPYKEKHQDEFAILILKRLKGYYGISKDIIDNWDKLFTSNYWKTLTSKLKMRQKAANYNERSQSLEQYIRHYAKTFEHRWTEYLPIVEYQLELTKSDEGTDLTTMMKQVDIARIFIEPPENHQAK